MPKVTQAFARRIGDRLGVDWAETDIRQFTRGLEVEHEHWKTVGGNWYLVGKIALDHLEEIPDYYTWLDAMEESAMKHAR